MDKTHHLVSSEDKLISRTSLAKRWDCSLATIKRRESEGHINPIRFNQRLHRYRLRDIEAYETSAQ